MAKKSKLKSGTKKVAEIYVVNIYNKGLQHNFDVLHNDEDNDTTLMYSNDEYWSNDIKGKPAGSLFDDGEQVNIDIDDVSFSLDYDQIERLTALILACSDSIVEVRESKVVASLNTNKINLEF